MGSDYIRVGITTAIRKSGLRLPRWSIILPTIGIITSESLLFMGFGHLALGTHLLTLLVCILSPVILKGDIGMFQIFALVPIYRLVNLGMPVFFELTVFWFPIIYGPIIPTVYFIGRANQSLPPKVGWKSTLVLSPIVIPVCGLLAAVEYHIIQPEALIPGSNLIQLLMLSIVMVGFVGLAEELLFRGVLQNALSNRLGNRYGILLASALFGLMHSGYGIPEELLFGAAIGVFFGVVYHRTESVALVTVMHGTLNVFLFAIIPFYRPFSALIPT